MFPENSVICGGRHCTRYILTQVFIAVASACENPLLLALRSGIWRRRVDGGSSSSSNEISPMLTEPESVARASSSMPSPPSSSGGKFPHTLKISLPGDQHTAQLAWLDRRARNFNIVAGGSVLQTV